jgi:hypothetical protein
MKKILFFAMVLALVGGLVIAKTADVPITPADLKDLKGAWTGERTTQSGILKTDLTISNDSLPLNGDMTFDFPRGRKVSETYTFEGRIEDGRLKLSYDQQNGLADLGLRKNDDGSMELKGTITYKANAMPVVFKKVK